MSIVRDKEIKKQNKVSKLRTSSIFYEQWYATIKSLPIEERDKAFQYILDYAFYGKIPEEKSDMTKDMTKGDKTICDMSSLCHTMSYVIFSMAKPIIDSAHKKYDASVENGKQGGRPKKVTKDVIEYVKTMRQKGVSQKEIANELSLSLRTIQRIEKCDK